jgi:hypothetical protein
MPERCRFDPSQGRFTVRAFAAGMLSAFAHSPTFAVRDYRGEIRFEGGRIDGMALDLTVGADSLDLLDKVSGSDRREIEERMRRDVLEVAAFPAITYQGRCPGRGDQPERVSAPHRRPAVAARRHPSAADRRRVAVLRGRHPPARRVPAASLRLPDQARHCPGRAAQAEGRAAPGVRPRRLAGGVTTGPRLLIACVGNIFLGDDAFGVEVARRLAAIELPEGVRVEDFGIRGIDLAYALTGR